MRDWATTFAGLRGAYFHVRSVELRLKQALKKVHPKLARSLQPPLSLTEITEEIETWRTNWDKPDISLPDDLMAWHLLTSVDSSQKTPLFGSMQDTHMGIACHPTPLKYYGMTFKYESIFVAAPFYRLCLSDTPLVKRGNVWVETEDGSAFVVAERWIDFVENYVLGLELGNFRRVKHHISKWPQLKAVEATTNDIKIRVSHMQHPCSQYLYMYHITISMSDTATRNKSKLRTRHWRIADASGSSEAVDGPGVVGAYPEIGPGDSFSYSSCCPLSTPTGTMFGHFRFEDMVTGEQWDCAVPKMNFVAQKTISQATIAAKDIQSS